jgi:Trk K+ transport system NAD-binding subunit
VHLTDRAHAVGRALGALGVDGLVEVTGVRRRGARPQHPPPEWVFESGDVVVLLGRPEELTRAEKKLLRG